MSNGTGIQPIALPIQPVPPVPPQPPFIASLPQAASTVPTDAALLNQLRALGTPEANAFIAAYQAFGNGRLLAQRIPIALTAANLPGEGLKPFLIHVARLSAEAFVFDVKIDRDKQFHLGFIEDPAHLFQGQPSQQEAFLHFAVRRLFAAASLGFTLEDQRRQMDKAIILFTFFQSELGREFRLTIASAAVLVEYRQLLFKIIQRHYQALMDALLTKASGGKKQFNEALKELGEHFDATIVTDLLRETSPKVPHYVIAGNLFRDYFSPASKSDFKFKFFSSRATPVTGDGPETDFRSVLKKRREQLAVLDELRPGPRPTVSTSKPGLAPARPDIHLQQSGDLRSQPMPPTLHDDRSWQRWVRDMWDSTRLSKAPPGHKLSNTGKAVADICGFVIRYFKAFTSHVPYDLAEGCGETSYLARIYPCAITGCLIHDCDVYATRWIYILGRLFAPESIPRELSNPRIFIIEMPSHVGVMIRARLPLGRDVLIGANNQDALVDEIDPDTGDEEAAEQVVAAMYSLTTPFVRRKIASNPSNQTALWNEICKMSGRKLGLPYDDSSEPFLNYLTFSAESAAIEKKLAEQMGELWRAMNQKLEAEKQPGKRRALLTQELRVYHDAIEPLFKTALEKFNKDMLPLAETIKADVQQHLSQKPKEAAVAAIPATDIALRLKVEVYRAELVKAEASLDLSKIDPVAFFSEDGFPTDVK